MADKIKKSLLFHLRLMVVLFTLILSKYNSHSVDVISASEIVTITDSIDIKLSNYIDEACEMKLKRVEKYRGKYICLFDARNYTSFMDYGKQDKRFIFSITPGVDSLRTMDSFPYDDDHYFDFFQRNDTLYSRDYYHFDGYYFDIRDNKWMKVDTIANVCYEDSDYMVSYLPYGEWGSYICFYDKSTRLKHLFSVPMKKILKYEGSYYIIGDIAVYKIPDPKKGFVKDTSVKITNMDSLCPKPEKVLSTRYDSLWELEFDYDENITDDTLFVSGYVYNDSMYLINNSHNDLFVAKYNKDFTQSEKIISLGNLNLYGMGEYGLASSWNQTGQFGFFRDNDQLGILDIQNDTVRFTYVKMQQDTLQYIGRQSFVTLMEFFSENLGKATMDDVKIFEKGFGGKTDGNVYDSWRNSYFPQHKNRNYQITRYYHAMDNVDSYVVEYCYHKKTKSVVSAFVEFGETRIFRGGNMIKYYSVWGDKTAISHAEIKEMVEEYVGQKYDKNNRLKSGNLTYRFNDSMRRMVIY